jgi:hypothetical protein
MFWIFAAVVLFLAVVNPDFRKVVLWLGAAALAVVILCVLLQLNSERSAAPVAAPVAAIEAPAPVVVPEPVAAPTPVAVVKHHHVKPAAPVHNTQVHDAEVARHFDPTSAVPVEGQYLPDGTPDISDMPPPCPPGVPDGTLTPSTEPGYSHGALLACIDFSKDLK